MMNSSLMEKETDSCYHHEKLGQTSQLLSTSEEDEAQNLEQECNFFLASIDAKILDQESYYSQ